MLPQFDVESGNLPEGVHEATWKDVEARLGFSSQRRALLGGLLKAARAFRDAGAPTLYLDGSFVTAKRDPSDYDCCYYAGHVDPDRIDPVLLDIDNAPAMKKAYKGEFYSALSEIKRPDFVGTFISFFRRDKDTHAQRGIVALDLASLP